MVRIHIYLSLALSIPVMASALLVPGAIDLCQSYIDPRMRIMGDSCYRSQAYFFHEFEVTFLKVRKRVQELPAKNKRFSVA